MKKPVKLKKQPFLQRLLFGIISIAVAFAVWLPSVHLLFQEDMSQYFSENSISPKAKLMINRQFYLWDDPAGKKEIERIRVSNPEWDFMWRTFTVWSLANVALKDPSYREKTLLMMDKMIGDTIMHIEKDSMQYFLMEYAKNAPFNIKPARSLFIDGEVSMMLSSRRLVEDNKKYKELQKKYIEDIIARMKMNKMLCSESYPDEYWVFDHSIALASIKIADYIDKTDHSAFIKQWLDMANEKLIDKKTGMLVSGFDSEGFALHGPEGSTIWMAAQFLRFIDPEMAEKQYMLAKKELFYTIFGFGIGREWPNKFIGYIDIDAGGILAGIGAGSASSGFAIVASKAFNDKELLSRMLCSLKIGGIPIEKNNTLKYAASNPVGDAAILYSMVCGPIYDKVSSGAGKK